MSESCLNIENLDKETTANNEATSSHNIYLKRLMAGANKNEPEDKDEKEDDLPTVEYEAEEIATKKVRLDVELSEETLPTKKSRKALIQHWSKVALLFIIWCIYAISIVTHKEQLYKPLLLALAPKQDKFVQLQPEPSTKTAIEVLVKGPFQIEQDVEVIPQETQPQLTLQVLMVAEDNKETIISKKWGLLIERPQELEYVLAVPKQIHMNLNEDISRLKQKAKLFLKLKTNIEKDLTVKLSCNMTPVDQTLGIIYGTFVLLFLYIMIIWEFINRTLASVVASTLAIGILAALNARPSTEIILKWLDVETLMLLFGMMILVAILSESGIFDYLAVLAYELARGELFYLIYVLCFFTAFLSAFLDNVTMMLLMTPVTIRLCEVTNLNPVPVLMSMVIYSNVGAALTPVGDPPNIIIMTNHYVETNGVNFGNFIAHMLPGVVLGLLTTFAFLYVKYPKISGYMNKQSVEIEALKHEIQVWEKAAQNIQPITTDEEIVQNTLQKKAHVLRQKLKELEAKGVYMEVDYKTTLEQMKASYPIRNKVLLIKASISFAFVLVLFFLHTVPDLQHLSLGWSALVGAILLLILADTDIEAVLSRVEWSTLLFFSSLFILMEALTELGLIGALGDICVKCILKAEPQQRLLVAILIILWISGIASAFLDNIPVTTMMIKIVVNLSQNKELDLPLPPLVWALAFGACFGGNGTLIGASANVVSSGVAEQHGYRFSFIDFFIFGFPIMLCTLVAATIYLYLAHCFWTWH
ncbi:P protein-like [Lucilia sericata]|uniref:P protein-like n=1 Tax=Lucilia sericata TaxID=13632 RepID=UPI0018A7FF3B|nr:P protein-like [Lucilia sericata]